MLYLARTQHLSGAEYDEREQREWRRLKGRLAETRVNDARILAAALERLG